MGRGIICIKIGDGARIKHGYIADILLTSEHHNKPVDEILSNNMLKVYGIIETTETRAKEIRAQIRPDYIVMDDPDDPKTWDLHTPVNKYKLDIETFVKDKDPTLETKWMSKDVVPPTVDDAFASKYLIPNTDSTRAVVDNNSIGSGFHTIGTAKDYASLLLFKNDIDATGLGNDMTGMIQTDTTNTDSVDFTYTEINDFTLHIDNDCSHRGDFMNRDNMYVIDSNPGLVKGIYYRAYPVSMDGTFVVSHQHFKRVDTTQVQEADVSIAVYSDKTYNAIVHDNLFESIPAVDNTGRYPVWYSGVGPNIYSYNNIAWGYCTPIYQNIRNNIIENTVVTGGDAQIAGNDYYGAQYSAEAYKFYNNYNFALTACYSGINDTTGYNNASEDLTADDFVPGGDNLISVDPAVELYSSDINDGELFALPKPSSQLIHTGRNPVCPGHDEYINGVPITTDRVHIGAKGLYVKPYGMFFQGDNQDGFYTASSFTDPIVTTCCFWACVTTEKAVHRFLTADTHWEITLRSNKVTNEIVGYFGQTGTLNLFERYHIACTWDQDATAGQIFINGALDNSYASSGSLPSGPDQLRVASYNATESFGGYMEDLRVYDRVLSANEIATVYGAKGNDQIRHGLMHQWLLNEGPEYTSPTVAVDYGYKGLNLGTVVQTPFYMGSELKTKRKYNI